jgi:hypothetical protein
LKPKRSGVTPQAEMEHTVLRVLAHNQQPEFARAHSFDRLRRVEAFRRHVPLRTRHEFQPYFSRVAAGEANVLTRDPPLGFSLADDGAALIPVNQADLERWFLADEILRGEALAIAPAAARGRWLTILPSYRAEETAVGLPVAPRPVLQALLQDQTASVPREVFSIEHETTRYYHLLRLTLDKPISVLQAASPGTLTILATYLEQLGGQVMDDARDGRISYLTEVSPAARQVIEAAPAGGRSWTPLIAQLSKVLRSRGFLAPREFWPRLSLLVCDRIGAAKVAADRLADRYGDLPLLDPGLRCAEGIVTQAVADQGAGRLFGEGQAWEFLEDSERGSATVLGLSQLVAHRRYRPILTSTSGLYRCLLDEYVTPVSFSGQVPLLIPSGVTPTRIDLCGGELDEAAVAEALAGAAQALGAVVSSTVAWIEPRPRVTLVWAVEPTGPLAQELAVQLIGRAERKLRERAPSYARARTEGQLAPARLLVLRPGTGAQLRQRRVAQGLAFAHRPLRPLQSHPVPLSAEDVQLAIDAQAGPGPDSAGRFR